MTDRLWASLMFFTRLPFWRIRQVDAECFKHVVDYWPFVGWLTGGPAPLVFWLVSGILPVTTAALAAIGTRLWLTGALHEDGLADFCDGFGGPLLLPEIRSSNNSQRWPEKRRHISASDFPSETLLMERSTTAMSFLNRTGHIRYTES